MSFTTVEVEYLVGRNASVAEATSENYGLRDRGFTATGEAKRQPGDRYDYNSGARLAVGRALIELGRQMVDAANREVDRLNNHDHDR